MAHAACFRTLFEYVRIPTVDGNRGANDNINAQRICCFADANHLANSE